MITRSRQCRLDRHRWAATVNRFTQARSVAPRRATGVGWPMPHRVTVSVADFATDITQSFLIMPGTRVRAELTGYVQQYPGAAPRVLTVPLTIAVF